MSNRLSARHCKFGWLWCLSLALSLCANGCRSFLAGQAMKTYPVKIKPAEACPAPNRYQEDFLYLKTLGEEVVPLQDRYFPPDKRAAMEEQILRKLGEPDCTYETFLFSIRSYLAAFDNEHARLVHTPKAQHFSSLPVQDSLREQRSVCDGYSARI
jgi:hypothetical protein